MPVMSSAEQKRLTAELQRSRNTLTNLLDEETDALVTVSRTIVGGGLASVGLPASMQSFFCPNKRVRQGHIIRGRAEEREKMSESRESTQHSPRPVRGRGEREPTQAQAIFST